ncbi:hypothetical protein J2Z69_000871 [Paenibacillus shirakamiensis]|uniref:Uncharacterized protein n=1 Tax=Paenibacillus shirakamiensis TaxID=1265935 RepID=A0ABS4JDR8_9BACL|nr:hypothetical protein [Paenibacillus shirakamiensis]
MIKGIEKDLASGLLCSENGEYAEITVLIPKRSHLGAVDLNEVGSSG